MPEPAPPEIVRPPGSPPFEQARGSGAAGAAGAPEGLHPAAASQGLRAAGAPEGGARARRLTWVALALAVVAALAAATLWQRSDGLAREAGRRLQQSEARMVQLEAQVKQAQDLAREVQGRSAVLESKLTEALGQQAQLERLYRDMSSDSIGAVLADVENSVAIASQQLVISGNVQGAVILLQDADGQLKRINQPDALGLRRLIARDLERLKALPVVDVVALALRLDSVAASLDQLPLVSGLGGTAASPAGAIPPRDRSGGFSLQRLASTGRQGWDALVAELAGLFRVNRVDAPDALLLAPEQQYFVRENLRLTLLSARLALLARSEPVFRSDLERAVRWLETYYDRQNRGVANAVATLRQLQATRIAAELPSLGDTLAAVRSARAAREAGR